MVVELFDKLLFKVSSDVVVAVFCANKVDAVRNIAAVKVKVLKSISGV